jgi:prepilin-type N-terminal cleavage/methylation domain-containing protein
LNLVPNKKEQAGFTLIELLLVIGILAVLLAITLIAVNPARQFGQANDTKRRSDINAILNAVGQYEASNTGNLPTDVTALSASASAIEINNTNFPNLCGQFVPTYIPALPVDPSLNNQAGISTCSGTWDTGYQMSKDTSSRITIYASHAYSPPIQITR